MASLRRWSTFTSWMRKPDAVATVVSADFANWPKRRCESIASSLGVHRFDSPNGCDTRRVVCPFRSCPCGNFEFGPDVFGDLRDVVVDKMSNTVMRNATQFCPVAQCGNRWFAVPRKDSAFAQTDDVRKRRREGRSRVHTQGGASKHAALSEDQMATRRGITSGSVVMAAGKGCSTACLGLMP